MKRAYDTFIQFYVYTSPYDEEYAMQFSNDWKFTEMLDYMIDHYSLNPDEISEVRSCFVKRYKVLK